MRVAALSDIHGNLDALDAVCAAAADLQVDQYVCLGDIVGYGAEPAGCIRRIRALTESVMQGNHDAAVAGLLDMAAFNGAARAAVAWTQQQLDEPMRGYLRALPVTAMLGDWLLSHASPHCPGAWTYLRTPAAAGRALHAVRARVCLTGHTHCPEIWQLATAADGPPRADHRPWPASVPVLLEPAGRYLVNVGSVGQPRDGDPRACFALCDTDAGVVRCVRVPYDVRAAQHRIRAAGLPELLARRLAAGR